jgi:hypothetical protein
MLKMLVAFFLWFATFTVSERVALVSAVLVLIGVVGEYVAEIGEVENRKRLCKRIKRLSMAILLIGLSGDALGIVMGQAEMAALTTKAGDAATSATIAHGEADKAQAAASSALALAGEAKQQAADAIASISEAKRLAEEAQKGTAVLARAALPRRLSEEQKVALVRSLSATPTFGVVFENTRSLSEEVLNFTDDFMDVFMRMHLVPAGSSSRKLPRAIAAPEGRGVIIGVMGVGQAEHPPAADVLIATLQSWGFEVRCEAAPSIAKSPTEIHILVGLKQ